MVTLDADIARLRSGANGCACTTAPEPVRRVVGTDVLYRHMSTGQPCWISTSDGSRMPLAFGRWLGGAASTQADHAVDEALLERCLGPTVDVGCGPGRLTAALAARGVTSLGVDMSAVAVEMTVQRGGRAIHHDVFAPMPDATTWTHALLADGNIGIGGNPLRLLQRVRQLLHPKGRIVADVESRQSGVRHEDRRWETHHTVSRWFPWVMVGADAVGPLAEAAGFHVVSTDEVADRSVVVLQVV
jgi:SAM-dependent methyltransferase